MSDIRKNDKYSSISTSQTPQPDKRKDKENRIHNLFHIIEDTSAFRVGCLTANVPGQNRELQFRNLAELLNIEWTSNLIKREFNNGNSWICLYFKKHSDLIKFLSHQDVQDKWQFIEFPTSIITEDK